MYTNLILPASMMVGTIIGAGMFSLPFAFLKSGLITGFSFLIGFALLYAVIYWLYADVILKTKGEHRFIGYAQMYLGQKGFWSAFFVSFVQLFFVLTVYLVLAPSFTKIFIGGHNLIHLLLFWFIGSLIIVLNVRKIAISEFLMVLGMLIIILLVFVFGAFKLDLNIFKSIGCGSNLLFSIGPVLFALSGTLAVPEVVSYFRESGISTKFLKGSLLLGSCLSAFAYGCFVFGVLGLSRYVSEDAISGLVGRAPQGLLMILGVLGLLSLMSSYIVVGLNVRKVLEKDLGFSRLPAISLVVTIPLLLYLIGFQSFIGTVSFMGSFFTPIEILLLIWIWVKVRKSHS